MCGAFVFVDTDNVSGCVSFGLVLPNNIIGEEDLQNDGHQSVPIVEFGYNILNLFSMMYS